MKNINKNIAVLITCHNRKLKTLKCLTALHNATLPKNHMMDIFLVDDGCSDGTALAVKKNRNYTFRVVVFHQRNYIFMQVKYSRGGKSDFLESFYGGF